MPSIVLFQLRWNQVPYAQRSASAERADKNSSLEERNAPVAQLIFTFMIGMPVRPSW